MTVCGEILIGYPSVTLIPLTELEPRNLRENDVELFVNLVTTAEDHVEVSSVLS